MDVPLEISYRDVEKTEYLENLIRQKAAKLEQVSERVSSVRVALEQDHKSRAVNVPYHVRLDVNVAPGHEFVIKRDSDDGQQYKDLPALVREAFEAAWIKLRKIKEKQKGKIKNHPQQEVNALVDKLFPEEDYGFLRTLDGRDVYFHRNALVNRELEELRPGLGVNFNVEQGDKGLQATSVQVVS